jgi:lipopolysaccharide/colanic/teichoic acid biosynthesis glycosyltransferase
MDFFVKIGEARARGAAQMQTSLGPAGQSQRLTSSSIAEPPVSETGLGRAVQASGNSVEGIPRPVEAILALLGLVASAPLIAISALAIRATSPGTVFFRQIRVGRNGQSFVLVKLRTMRTCEEGPQVTTTVDSRVTLVGRFLRKTKLDELPELWNVLKGEMSLVGPRPEVPRYVDLKDLRWQVVLQARPGLTDPVTLRLRNEEKLLAEVDGEVERFYLGTLQPVKLIGYLEYLGRRNCTQDLKVILKTALGVVWPSRTPAPTVAQIRLEASAFEQGIRDSWKEPVI